MKKFISFILIAVSLVALSSCGKSKNQLMIKGSDTEVNLVTDFAENYMKLNKNIRISVTGGGSGTGIAALLNGQVHIANASRTIKKKELKKAAEKNIKPVWVVIATDGVSVIIHPSNPVNNLTIAQLAAIFKGKIKNWKEVGGKDKAITCYGRQSNSGTYEFFKKKVLRKKDFSADVNRMNGNSQIVASIKKDESGVGYVGIGYITDENGNFKSGLKVVSLAKKDGAAFIEPSEKAIMSGKYPLTRPLNQYVNGNPTGITKAFLKWCVRSSKAAALVKKSGFYPIQPKYNKVNKAAGL